MKTICDNCNNFETSGSGSLTKCWAYLLDDGMIKRITKDYVEKRMNGQAKTCKEYKKITCKFK
jgi:hypothetical protein